MGKKVLVTGANGNLGLNTVRSLLKRGYEVKPFVRKTSDLTGLKGLPLTCSFGDVRDQASLTEAAKGCDVIIHHAAVYQIWARTVEEIMEPAVEGAKNIFAAASETGIQRLIYTSSNYAVGTSNNPTTIRTEKDWNDNEYLPYGIAKVKSEKLAWELSERYNIPMISLLPGAIYGRYDYRVTPSNRMILDMLKGIGMTAEGVLSFIDARDAGEIHALAIEEGRVGERYILTCEATKIKDIGKMVTSLTGKRVTHLPFGRSINIATGKLMEVVANATGWNPPFTAGVAREYSHRYAQYDNSNTLEDFNIRFHTLEETLGDTIKWFLYLNKVRLAKKVADKFQPDVEWIQNDQTPD